MCKVNIDMVSKVSNYFVHLLCLLYRMFAKEHNALNPYNSGLKLINCLIPLAYVAVVRQIQKIQLDFNYCERLSNCIKTLINQNIQSPLLTKLFKIAVYEN